MNLREPVERHPTLSRHQLAASLVTNLRKIRSLMEPFGDTDLPLDERREGAKQSTAM